MAPPTSFLDRMRADWLARGWSLEDLDRFRMEDEGGGGDGGDGGGDGGAGAQGGGSDRGFPESTPLAEMTVEQREAYWKHQARKHETTAKARSDYDDLKAKAAELEELKAAGATDQEKAVKAARDEAAAEERRQNAPRLVGAEFRAAAKGVLTDEQRDALLEDLDLTKYLDDKGEVDVDKVEKKIKAFAPGTGDEGGRKRTPGSGGQGRRDGGKTSAREAGRAEAAKRFGKPAGQQQ